MKILIVDDDPAIVDLLKHFVEERGHCVEIAGDGQYALELFDSKQYDLVFSDHDMPEMTGIELIKAIKERSPQTITVLLTGYETMKGFFAQSLGSDEYLEKPANLKMIEEILIKYEGKNS